LFDRWPVLLLGGRQLQRGLERSETRIGKRGEVIGRQLRVMRPVGWSWLLGKRKGRAGHHQHSRAGEKCLPHGDLQESVAAMASLQVNTLIAVSKNRCISAANSAGRIREAIWVEPRTSA